MPYESVWSGYEIVISSEAERVTVNVPLISGGRQLVEERQSQALATVDAQSLANACVVGLVSSETGVLSNIVLAIGSGPSVKPIPFGEHLAKAVGDQPSADALAQATRETLDR